MNFFSLGHGRVIGGAEGGGEKARYDVDEAGSARFGSHAGDGVVGHLMAGAAQTSTDDADGIARAEPAASEALGQSEHVLVTESGFEFGKCAERQAEAE